MRRSAVLLLLFALGCEERTEPREEFACTFFETGAHPEMEDFPQYLYCISDRRRVFFFWHEVADIFGDMGEAEIEEFALPDAWFDEDGFFEPDAFWIGELGIIHLVDGVHDPCGVPELLEFLGAVPCAEPLLADSAYSMWGCFP